MDEDISDNSGYIIRIAAILLIGIILLFNIDAGVNLLVDDSTTFTFSSNPVDGDTIAVNDNVFEFDFGDGVVENNIPVQIGDTMRDTADNLQVELSKLGYNVD